MTQIVTSRCSLRALALASAAMAGPILFSGSAHAQGTSSPAAEDPGVADIVVTAQRREESLQDVPLSIVAIGSEALRNDNITEVSRLEQLAPGLRLGRSGADPRPAIRGIITESIQGNADPRVGFYIDEIYQSRTSQTSVPFVDLERVEVQKGPQGTLFGRNSYGGNIAISTAKPSMDGVEGGINALGGSYNRVLLDGHLNLPLSESIAVRFAGAYERRDGFIKSVTAPGFADMDDKNQFYLRGSLRFAAPGSPLEVILRASHWSDNSKGAGTFNAKAIGQFIDPALVTAPGGTLNVGGATFTFPNGFNGRTFQGQFYPFATFRDGIVDVTINGVPLDLGYPVLGPYKVLHDAPSKQRIRSTQLSMVINYDISESIRLRSITGYNKFSANRSTDNDGTPANYGIGYFLTENKAFSQELQLQSTGEGPLTYTLGAYYLNDEVPDGFLSGRTRNYSTAAALANTPGTGNYPLYFGSNFTVYPSSGGGVVNLPPTAYITPNASDAWNPLSYAKNVSYALYGQVSYTLNDKLTLTGGLRYTIDEKDLRSALATPGLALGGGYLVYKPTLDFNRNCDGVTAADPSSTATAAAVANALTTRCGKDTFKYFTYRLAADYKINDDVMLYASYSTGKHSGGFSYSPLSNTAGQPLPPYGTESVQAWEAGIKATLFDRRLQFNLAAFYNKYSDLQVQTSFPNPLLANSVITILSNGATSKAPGIDLSIVAYPTSKLRLNFALNYLHARDDPFGVSVGQSGICGIVAPGGTCTTRPEVGLGYLGGILPNPVSNPSLFSPIRDAAGNQIVVGGVPQFTALGYNTPTRVQNTPDISFQIGAAYEIDLGSSGTLTPEVQMLYTGDYLLSRAFRQYLAPDYTKTELRLTYRTVDKNFTAQAFVENLENNATIGRVTVASGGGFSGSYAAPRTWGVKVGYKF